MSARVVAVDLLAPESIRTITKAVPPSPSAADLQRRMQDADGEFILLKSPNSTVPPGSITALVRLMDEHPAACMAGSSFRGRHLRLARAAAVLFGFDGSPAHADPAICPGVTAVPAVWGPCILVRRQVFLALDGLDLSLATPFALLDFALRARLAGWTTWVDSRVVVEVAEDKTCFEFPHVPSAFSAGWSRYAAQGTRDWNERRCLPLDEAGRGQVPRDGRPPGPVRVLIDLARLSRGGASGGIKVFVIEILRALVRATGPQFRMLWLLPAELADESLEFTGADDEIWLLPAPGRPATVSGRMHQLTQAEPWLARSLNTDVLYAPLGVSDFRTPDMPTIGVAVDVLHRNFPASLPLHDVAARERWFREMATTDFRIQCISQWTADRVAEHFQVRPERLFVTHCAVHSRIPHVPRDNEAGDRVFLYPANSWPHKNHRTLLEGYAQYVRKVSGTPWPLVLTGHNDDGMRDIATHAESLGIGDHVVIRGFLGLDDFAQLWNRTGALIFPSLHEGFGIPLLEAMRMGVPIVAGRVCSIPEVAGDACLYVDVRDAAAIAAGLLRIQADSVLRTALVERGLGRAKQFEIEPAARALATALSDAASSLAGSDANWRWSVGPPPAASVCEPVPGPIRSLGLGLKSLWHVARARMQHRARLRSITTETADPLLHHVDSPAAWDNPVAIIFVQGWCVATAGSPVVRIEARWGRRSTCGAYGTPRPDVAAHLGRADLASCGFSLRLIRSECISQTVSLVAVRANGLEWCMASVTVT